jgi:hypothetical protein
MDAKIGSISLSGNKIVALNHPPVLETRTMTAGVTVIPAGEIMAFDATGGLVQYDPDAVDSKKDPVGVLIEEANPATEEPDGVILVHGTVRGSALTVQGAAADADAIAAIRAIGIYAV